MNSQNKTFSVALTYSGSRWLANICYLDQYGRLTGYDDEYHAFWRGLYEQRTFYVSEPTSEGSIIGVDCELIYINAHLFVVIMM